MFLLYYNTIQTATRLGPMPHAAVCVTAACGVELVPSSFEHHLQRDHCIDDRSRTGPVSNKPNKPNKSTNQQINNK
jgi:hypothetical protein